MDTLGGKYHVPIISSNLSAGYTHQTVDRLTIIPGVTIPFRVAIGSKDNRPLSIVGLQCHIMFWREARSATDDPVATYADAEVVFTKVIDILDPYSGFIDVVLDIPETTRIGTENLRSPLVMSVVLETPDGSERYPINGPDDVPYFRLDVDYKSLPIFSKPYSYT